jgi:hypothetical protein
MIEQILRRVTRSNNVESELISLVPLTTAARKPELMTQVAAAGHPGRGWFYGAGRLPRFAAGISASAVFAMLVAFAMLATPAASFSQFSIGISVNVGPPPLPVYTQPPCLGPGYIWTPGYWAYDEDGGYYWVPGSWVLAPFQGALWTPGYWGWSDGGYAWNEGYWGPVVGFYGGINYGYGYFGRGYEGGTGTGGPSTTTAP